jgi:Glycoside hydrolase family 2 C-terminal domain 5
MPEPDKLMYDVRPTVNDRNDNVVADSKPNEAVTVNFSEKVLKKWVLPSANDFIKDSAKHHKRPDGNPEPGQLKVIAYKNGKQWATEIVETAGKAAALQLSADRNTITADGKDLSFITLRVIDSKGITVPESFAKIKFEVSGPGEIVATDNGDPSDLVAFHSKERNVLSGLALVIVRANSKMPGIIKITASSEGLSPAQITIKSQ